MAILSLLHALVQRLVALLDRTTEAPIMTRRINAGSDEYFRWHASHPGETELDDVLDPLSNRDAE